MKTAVFTVFVALMMAISHYCPAQDPLPTDITVIKTRDGNEFMGKITFEDDEKIVLLTEKFGEVTIRKIDILSREIVKSSRIVDGTLWADNPQSTRYFFGPNGYGLKKGEGYYQNVWIFFNQVSVGVSENFSFSVGMVPLFLFAGTATPVWLNPKVSVPVIKDKYNVGAGALLGTVIGEGSSFGILYGVNTFGNKDKNVAIGLGWGFSDGQIATRPTVSVSGMYRTGAKGYLLTENYFISTGSETLGIISFGGRRIIQSVGLDFGLLVPFTSGFSAIVAIPWLGLTVPFGRKNQNNTFAN